MSYNNETYKDKKQPSYQTFIEDEPTESKTNKKQTYPKDDIYYAQKIEQN